MDFESLTLGDFRTEMDSESAFDKIVGSQKQLWHVEKECKGTYLSVSPGQERGSCRIDRVLLPTRKLIEAGWTFGPIGVEIKRSNEKIGRPSSQCIDYRDAAFELQLNGARVLLDQIFLWPLGKIGGPVESLISQRRVGGVYAEAGQIRFMLGQQQVLVVKAGELHRPIKTEFIKRLGRKRGNLG